MRKPPRCGSTAWASGRSSRSSGRNIPRSRIRPSRPSTTGLTKNRKLSQICHRRIAGSISTCGHSPPPTKDAGSQSYFGCGAAAGAGNQQRRLRPLSACP